MSTPSDNDMDVSLMLKTGQGDTKAFTELINRHKDSVIGTIGKMLGGQGDVEDLAQQVFIRVWKSAKSYEASAKFTTWLFTITKNLVFNETRRLSKKRTISHDEISEQYGLEIIDNTTLSPEEHVLHEELQSAVDQALSSLPEKARMAIILRRYEDMSYEDIADTLKVSVPALKSILFRARTQLKELLTPYFNDQ